MSYLYVIASVSDTNVVKLGLSKHPEKRLKQLQTASPYELKVFHQEEVSSERVNIAEKALHSLLRHKKLKGEWFDLSVEEAISEVIYIRITEDLAPI